MFDPREADRISEMLDLSPEALALGLDCSPTQARSLQQYVTLTVVVAFRRERGEPHEDERLHARRLFRCLPPGLKLWLCDGLRFAA
jgi:hypothetical protein